MGQIFLLILVILLAYRNGNRARQKGRSAIGWGVLTAFMLLMCEFIGTLLVVLIFLKDKMDFDKVSPDNQVAVQEELKLKFLALIEQNPAHGVFILMCGFGGYLLVRYMLERLPYNK